MNKKRRLIKRIISLVLAISLILANDCFDGFSFPIGKFFHISLKAEAAYTPVTADPGAFTTGQVTINSISMLKDYAYYYNSSPDFAASHQNDTLLLSMGSTEYTIDQDYIPIGTERYPFNGSLLFNTLQTIYTLQTYVPLFDYITDSAVIGGNITLNLFNRAENHVILANHVSHGNGTSNWNLYIDDNTNLPGGFDTTNSVNHSGIIGEMGQDASVTINLTDNSGASVSGSDDIGLICGKMGKNSKITISLTRTVDAYNVTSTSGKAGALVGKMLSGSSIELTRLPAASDSTSVTANTSYAGGLVGYAEDASIVIASGGMTVGNDSGVTVIPVKGSINSANSGAGGIYGYYKNSSSAFDLSKYNITATVDGKYCGGVFGVLENKDDSGNPAELTVNNTNNAGTISVKSGTAGDSSGYFGGIAGKYLTDSLANSLVLDGLTLSVEDKASYKAFGGAIGLVDSVSYIKTIKTDNGISINAKGTDKSTIFGGLIGETSSNGVFVDLRDFTLSTGSEAFKGGGVVGDFHNGVLRLSGTTTMTNAKPRSDISCGQLIGINNNVLTYALGTGDDSGWTYNRSNGAKADDLGTWGEVVRLSDIEDGTAGILTYDSEAHTVTIKAAVPAMGNVKAFAKTALNIQLNQGSDYDCLKFTSGNNTRSYLLRNNLSLTDNISLSGTGITGLMRDGGTPENNETYTGTFDGNDNIVTLSAGEHYGVGVSGQSEGMGQIYRHQRIGLFASLSGTVKNVTVNGTINTHSMIDGMNIGGIAAINGGDVTLTKVISNITVNDYGEIAGTTEAGKNIGGYIGFVETNGLITIDGASVIGAKFNLSGKKQTWNTYGGAIGKITAGQFTVNIGTKGDGANKLTNRLITNISGITGVETNGDGGGLIGYITKSGSYNNRTVNLNSLKFDGCTVGNAASTNGGGFLGYAWLNTTTNVKGVTVTDGNINNTAAGTTTGNVGVMLYSSTGKMTVDSLVIDGLTMSSGGGSSLGMIVNKAYDGDDGLYLDVLNAGYTLTCSAPSSVIFDEIAAFSSNNVIAGGNGTGVISINMNSDRTVSIASFMTTGTYQNKLKTGSACANFHSRYYYNLDKMSSSDDGQNLVLWSVKKYSAPNIQGEFVPSNTPLSGNSNLTGLSFYPVANANEDYTIGTLTLTFDYSGIYGTAETVNNSDSYIRDPADSNQHYLMHSGLFINQPSGKSLNINGKLSLSGTFMEDSEHQGVIISGTENGDFNIGDSGSVELDGIKPMNGASSYENGYLLINKIIRESNLVAAPSLTIKNVYTTDKYSDNTYTEGHTNATVAKSLFGAASGKGLNIAFSHIKLDARSLTNNAVKSDVALEALYNAYGTYNSIFTDSTLLASINTDQAATLVYNYTYDEDWEDGEDDDTVADRFVTYGKEVSSSQEYAGKEKKYYGAIKNFTNPVSNANEEYDFSSGFLKYVAAAFNSAQTDGQFSRELKVNVMVEGLTDGCGTYNDPYVITTADQLITLAALLQANGSNNDMGTLNLPKNSSNYNSLAKNTTGSRWCTDKSGTGYHAEYKAQTGGTGYESTVSGASVWTLDNVKYYLANAYYVIGSDITLDNTFVGLGGTSANLAFRGVIVGGTNQNGSPKYTITNNSSKPFINVSNGCVVKDISIKVDADIALKQDKSGYNEAYFGYDSKCNYYGGIIGEIMGGDNIIDNSYVSFKDDKKITLSGSYGTIVPVGGYVGVVVFGGLIFKNMDASKTTISNTKLNVICTGKTYNLADNSGDEAWAAIYVNPIVGRVINGYAVNETGGKAKDANGEAVQQFSVTEDGNYHDQERNTRSAATVQHTLKNGTKHYSIADIDPSLDKLDVASVPTDASTDGTINIPNSQAMFILSLITQSTSGTAQTASGDYVNSLSYGINTTVYGKSQNANYSDVGTDVADETQVGDYNTLASGDTAANTAVPYIIKYYCTSNNARCATSTKGYYDINLTGTDAYVLPDSFRGLGSVGLYDSNSPGNNTQVEPPEAPGGRKGNGTTDGWKDRASNKFPIKLDEFNGNNKVIDIDIYLNKYIYDNYLNKLHSGKDQDVSGDASDYTNQNNDNKQMHGIGLFDSVITKSASSAFVDFTLSGSVNTQVFSNKYASSNQELINVSGTAGQYCWLNTGGVCGWALSGMWLKFQKVKLNDLSIRGATCVGGLLASSGNKSKTYYVICEECSAENIKLNLSVSTSQANRSGIGAFVGKVKEGGVLVYGTDSGKDNTDTSKYSTVEISAFDSIDNSTVISGGLVGYAGNGCQAYDMHVQAKDGCDVTVGTSNQFAAGGIVGLMQPVEANYSECFAEFINCEVSGINITASQYAGGFYGGTWNKTNPINTGFSGASDDWTIYRINVQNCKVNGNPDSNNTIIATNGIAGGFIADAFVIVNAGKGSNISISNSHISHYTIEGKNHANARAGGFLGYANAKGNNSVVCYIHDSSVEDCTIGASGKYAGGVIGEVAQNTENKILGYNIKLDTITDGTLSGNTSNIGAWIGKATPDGSGKTTRIQFAGLAIYGNGFSKNVGNNATLNNASFVFSSYDKSKLNTGTAETEPYISTFNNDDNVISMPGYPYVNISPVAAMGVSEVISGDGAVLYGSEVSSYTGTGNTTMAAKILSDIDDTSNSRRYTTFSGDPVHNSKNIDEYLNRNITSEGDRISTWKTEKDLVTNDYDDFAVIVIANESGEETTNLLNRYIQLVTNTATDYTQASEYYHIDTKACKYNEGIHNFEITDDPAGIIYTAGNTNAFTVNREGADSLSSDRFTLVDVQFKDPLNTDKIAYHLYVPVYVKRSISAKFSSTALSGTGALASDYISSFKANNNLVENLDNWVTSYIRYQYSQQDVQAILDSGMLNWNSSKEVKLTFDVNATGQNLPADASLVLIDPNGDIDETYYSSGREFSVDGVVTSISLSKFHKGYSDGKAFKEQTFGDVLGLGNCIEVTDLSETEQAGTGYYNVGSEENYDIKVGDEYYSYVPGKNGDYNISATDVFNEDYYISMLVPSNEAGTIYRFDIQAPKSLAGNMVTYVSLDNDKKVDILLGDLFEQDFLLNEVAPNDHIITDTNNQITVHVQSKVKLKGTSIQRSFYAGFLTNTSLYHADVLTFTRHDINGADNTIYGTDASNIMLSDTKVNGESVTPEKVLSGSYIMIKMGDIMSGVLNNVQSNDYDGATIEATAVVTFPNYAEEFPGRPDDQESSSYGVNAAVSSSISYGDSDLAFSGKKIIYTDSSRYYIQDVNSAYLRYEADDELDRYDSVGSASYNYSLLGNNGYSRGQTCNWPNTCNGMPIYATAKYNANAVTNYDDADTVVYKLELYKKTDDIDENTGRVTGVSYRQVPIDSYLKNVGLTGGAQLTMNTESSTSMTYYYSEPKNLADVDEKLFTVHTYYEVVTGTGFTDYANYQVRLEVQLRNSSGTVISNSTAKDYIVYTNAKIYPEVIQE